MFGFCEVIKEVIFDRPQSLSASLRHENWSWKKGQIFPLKSFYRHKDILISRRRGEETFLNSGLATIYLVEGVEEKVGSIVNLHLGEAVAGVNSYLQTTASPDNKCYRSSRDLPEDEGRTTWIKYELLTCKRNWNYCHGSGASPPNEGIMQKTQSKPSVKIKT